MARRARQRRAAKIVELVEAGVSKSEINRRLGFSLKTIRKVVAVKKEGGTPSVGAYTRVDYNAVRRLHQAGLTKAEISRKLQISWTTTITRTLKSTSISPRPDDSNNVRRQRALEVLALVDRGIGSHEIARRLRVGLDSIAN